MADTSIDTSADNPSDADFAADSGGEANLGGAFAAIDKDEDGISGSGEGVASPPVGDLESSAGTPESSGKQAAAQQPDLVSVFEQEIEALRGGKPQEDDVDLNPPEGVDPNSKAGNRWQQLANQNRDLRNQMAQVQQSTRSYEQYANQMRDWAQRQVTGANQQVAALQQRLDAMQQQFVQFQQSGQQQDDPLAKLQGDIRQQTIQEMQQNYLNPLMQEVQALKQQRVQDQQAVKQTQASAMYKQQAIEAARNITLKGLPQELVNELGEGAAATVLTDALYNQTSIEEAAKLARMRYFMFARGVAKANSASLQESLAKSRSAPPAPAAKPGRGTGVKIPTDEELGKMGYTGASGLLDWAIDNEVELPST